MFGVNTGNTCTFGIYHGNARAPPHGTIIMAHNTAIRLLSQANLLNICHNVSVDNFISSTALFQNLLSAWNNSNSTVRSNRQEP